MSYVECVSPTLSVEVAAPTALTIGVSPTPPVKPGASLSFTGKLTRTDTGAGIAGQTVTLEQPLGTAVMTGTTDSAGNYELSITASTEPGVYEYQTVFGGTIGLRRAESQALSVDIVEPTLVWTLASAFVGMGLLIASKM